MGGPETGEKGVIESSDTAKFSAGAMVKVANFSAETAALKSATLKPLPPHPLPAVADPTPDPRMRPVDVKLVAVAVGAKGEGPALDRTFISQPTSVVGEAVADAKPRAATAVANPMSARLGNPRVGL